MKYLQTQIPFLVKTKWSWEKDPKYLIESLRQYELVFYPHKYMYQSCVDLK